MTFSVAQYQATIDDLTSGLTKLSGKIDEVPPVVSAATNHWYIPQEVTDAIVWIGEKMIELGTWILNKINELMQGALAPVMMFGAAWDWQDVRGMVNGVAGNLKPEQLTVGRLWHGPAADAYARQIKPQADAATRIGTMSDKAASSLTICAVSGLAFYVALGVILIKFTIAFIVALTALGSAVFSWAGAELIVEEAAVNTGMIIAAASALTAVLGAQASQMVTLHGEAKDPNNFPTGHWPDATPGQFSDATVTDKDADWSLRS
jgi:hypothetical protein